MADLSLLQEDVPEDADGWGSLSDAEISCGSCLDLLSTSSEPAIPELQMVNAEWIITFITDMRMIGLKCSCTKGTWWLRPEYNPEPGDVDVLCLDSISCSALACYKRVMGEISEFC